MSGPLERKPIAVDATVPRLDDAEALRLVIAHAAMPVCITDPNLPDNPVVFVNAAFTALTGYGEAEMLGRNCRFLQGADDDQPGRVELRRAIEERRTARVVLRNFRKDGTMFWNEVVVSPVFGRDGALRYFFSAQTDVSDRQNAADRLERSHGDLERLAEARAAELEQTLRHREMLIHELQHRVRNNLQVMASMINLEIGQAPDGAVRARMASLLHRVRALEIIYRQLRLREGADTVELSAYLEQICRNLSDFHDPAHRVEIGYDMQPCAVAVEAALPIGLIVNELVVNAFKHAFADRDGRIDLGLVPSADGGWVLTVVDTGPGLPEGLDFRRHGNLGARIIGALARQVGGDLTIESGPGLRATLRFDPVRRSDVPH